ELLNPTATPYSNVTGIDPLGDGSARLRWDQSDLNQAYLPATPPVTLKPFAAYRLVIAHAIKTGSGTNVQSYLNAGQDNVTGTLPIGATPDIDYDFIDTNVANAGASAVVKVNAPNGNSVYNPNGDRTQGIVLVGPTV